MSWTEILEPINRFRSETSMKQPATKGRFGKPSPSFQAESASEAWYFVRLAFLAIPWQSRRNKAARGTRFKQYYLVRAKNIKSAFNKARHILSVSEHCEGDGWLNGKRVIFKGVGILDLEPLYESLQSGVELFDESEVGVAYTKAKQQVIPNRRRLRMIAHEKKMGKPSLLDVNWGEKFNRL